MKWFEAQRLPQSIDLSAVLLRMSALKIPCRVSEESGEQVIWLAAPEHRALLQEALQALHDGVLEMPILVDAPRRAKTFELRSLWLDTPVTFTLIFISFLGALLVEFDSSLQWVRHFTFVDFLLRGNAYFFHDLNSVVAQYQYWRFITPMFLHFGLFHILFNSLWVWEMGRRIERRRSSFILISLTLVVSLAANSLQFIMSGPSIFGGMSGVIYGYLGYIWMWQKYFPERGFKLPAGIIGFMLIWLVLCFTGAIDWLLAGQIANGAHLGGLLGGMCFGLVSILWAKLKLRNSL